MAAHLNADAIELDAKPSADGHVVVIHDQTVDRTTPSSGQVGDLSLSELRTLDAGSHFDITYKNETIPTLDEIFGSCGGEIYINVELTNYASIKDDLPDKVAQLVKKHKLEENILIFRIRMSIKANIAAQEVTPQLIISGSSIFYSFLLMIEKKEKKKVRTGLQNRYMGKM